MEEIEINQDSTKVNVPPDALAHFGFDSFRKYQDAIVATVYHSILTPKHVILESPTGSGKTAAVLAASLPLLEKNNLRMVYAVRTHQQIMTVLGELKKIQVRRPAARGTKAVGLYGRHELCIFPLVSSVPKHAFNSTCSMVKNALLCPFYTTRAKTVVTSSSALMDTYEATGPAELKRTFKAREFCPYEALVLSLKEADIVVVTYNYILNEFMRSLLLRRMVARPSELILMIDEAHNLPRLATNLDEISVKTIARAAEEARKYGLYELADKTVTLHEKLVQMPIDEEVEVDRKLFSELNVQEIINAARYVQELKLWSSTVPSSYLQVLGDFLGPTLRENSLLLLTLQGARRRLEAVNLNPLKTTKALFESVYSSVSMSGTLSPSEVYAKIAGLPENTLSIRVGYPFSRHNMRVYGVTGISTRYEERKEELYVGIYNVLSSTARSLSILGQFQLGYGAGVFFASHDLLDSFMVFLSQRHLKLPWEEILTEKRNMDSDAIEELFDQFVGAASKSSALLLAVQGARPAQ